jgi:vacuolar protein sorting-associated protein 54
MITSLSEGIADSTSGNGEQKSRDTELLDSTRTLSQTCLVSACDVAQRALAQLLSLKKNDMARITLEKMKQLWETAMSFISEVERVADTSAYIIRQALHAQTSMFLQHIHERNKLRIISTMDHEKWVQCDVPVEIQASFERLVAGRAMSDNSSTKHPSSSGPPSSSTVVIEGMQYKVVWSVLELSSAIMSYLDIAMCFSSVTGDVINMTKDLVQLFNKSANMLVLGSGAQKSLAQLRSISAKHLTATAQSLAVLLAVLPHVRAALLTQLPSNRSMLLLELDRVSQDLLEHHGNILSKFVAIVSDSMDSALPKLKQMDWDNTGGERCEYFELLSKNLEALHRVLITDSTLPLEQAQDVFSRVFSLLQRKLPKHFEAITPATKAGRQRILDEVGHLGNALALLRFLDSNELVKALDAHFSNKYDQV